MASSGLVLQPAILGSLIARRNYPYAVFSDLTHKLRGIAPVATGPVYRNIHELVKKGELEWTGESIPTNHGGHDSKIYTATPGGETHLAEWVRQPRTDRESPVDYLRLRLRVVPSLTLSQITAMLGAYEEDLLQVSKAAAVPVGDVADPGQLSDEAIARRFADELDQSIVTAQVLYVDRAKELAETVAEARAARPLR